MPSLVRFGAAVALLVAATSCGGPTDTANTTENTTDGASPSASPAASTGDAPKAAVPTADFKSPMVAGRPTTAVPVLQRFIQPTNIDAQAKQTQTEIQKNAQANRRDPFAIPIQVQPLAKLPDGTPVRPMTNQAPRPIGIPDGILRLEPDDDSEGRAFRGYPPPGLADPPKPKPKPPAARRPTSPASPASPASPTSPASRPMARPASPTQPAKPATPPPPPSPADAIALRVTGVVQVGNEFKVIVQIPGENSERYVSVGDRIANGQVLVKRVELNKLLDPVVVFEQYGQEVAKNVGEASAPIAMR